MTLPRRDFLKTTLTVSTAAVLANAPVFGAAGSSAVAGTEREYYELRAYRLKSPDAAAPLNGYLEKALISALNKRGIARVGVFTETAPKDGPAVWVLIPHPSLDSFVTVSAELNTDPDVLAAGADYLQVGKGEAAFERIDSWLLRAFAGMPKLELPAYSLQNAPRMFEMRSYESFSEVKALKKMAMFNEGEMDVMREVQLAPVFFGQALTGSSLPHLTYMTSATDADTHKAHWTAFGKHPQWVKMRDDPQYADTVSKNTQRFLVPAPFSQI